MSDKIIRFEDHIKRIKILTTDNIDKYVSIVAKLDKLIIVEARDENGKVIQGEWDICFKDEYDVPTVIEFLEGMQNSIRSEMELLGIDGEGFTDEYPLKDIEIKDRVILKDAGEFTEE